MIKLDCMKNIKDGKYRQNKTKQKESPSPLPALSLWISDEIKEPIIVHWHGRISGLECSFPSLAPFGKQSTFIQLPKSECWEPSLILPFL